MPTFFEKIIQEWNGMRTLEVWGTIFGLLQVVLAYNNKSINFLFAILSSSIMVYILAFSDAKLYAEAVLQLYYFILGIYGWYNWSRPNKDTQKLLIQFANKKNWIITFIISFLGVILTYLVLSNYTDSNVPFADASVFGLAWAGTYLMTHRKVENWLILNISNLISIPLLFYKGLYFFGLFTIVLFFIAIFGYIKWRKLAMVNDCNLNFNINSINNKPLS